MIQTIVKDFPDYEKGIKELYDTFKATVGKGLDLVEDTREYDLDKIYNINWYCNWNKPEHLNTQCKILHKNSYIAVVSLKGIQSTGANLLERIFRLEDLSII